MEKKEYFIILDENLVQKLSHGMTHQWTMGENPHGAYTLHDGSRLFIDMPSAAFFKTRENASIGVVSIEEGDLLDSSCKSNVKKVRKATLSEVKSLCSDDIYDWMVYKCISLDNCIFQFLLYITPLGERHMLNLIDNAWRFNIDFDSPIYDNSEKTTIGEYIMELSAGRGFVKALEKMNKKGFGFTYQMLKSAVTHKKETYKYILSITSGIEIVDNDEGELLGGELYLIAIGNCDIDCIRNLMLYNIKLPTSEKVVHDICHQTLWKEPSKLMEILIAFLERGLDINDEQGKNIASLFLFMPLECLKQLPEYGVKIFLTAGAYTGDYKKFKWSLKYDQNPDCERAFMTLAKCEITDSGKYKIAKYLHENLGVDFKKKGIAYANVAIQSDNYLVLKYLLEQGVSAKKIKTQSSKKRINNLIERYQTL